jgi:hypothetical protein
VKRAAKHAARPPAVHPQKHAVHYVCIGNCLGLATEDEFRKGAKSCNVIVCSHYGRPLKKMHYDPAAKKHYEPGKQQKK